MNDDTLSSNNVKELLDLYKIPLILISIGILFAIGGFGVMLRQGKPAVEFSTEEATASAMKRDIVVDVSGAVNDPGVYYFDTQIRVSDIVEVAGGFSEQSDTNWISKNLNLASPVADGAKIYIPFVGEGDQTAGISNSAGVSSSKGSININSASASELDALYGVGPKTAEKIINNRPYTSIEELVEKGVLGQKGFDKIRDEITIF